MIQKQTQKICALIILSLLIAISSAQAAQLCPYCSGTCDMGSNGIICSQCQTGYTLHSSASWATPTCQACSLNSVGCTKCVNTSSLLCPCEPSDAFCGLMSIYCLQCKTGLTNTNGVCYNQSAGAVALQYNQNKGLFIGLIIAGALAAILIVVLIVLYVVQWRPAKGQNTQALLNTEIEIPINRQ